MRFNLGEHKLFRLANRKILVTLDGYNKGNQPPLSGDPREWSAEPAGKRKGCEPAGATKMLVLSRHEGEMVLIGAGKGCMIVVKVLSIVGNRVKLAFAAPDNVRILRAEIQPPPDFFD